MLAQSGILVRLLGVSGTDMQVVSDTLFRGVIQSKGSAMVGGRVHSEMLRIGTVPKLFY